MKSEGMAMQVKTIEQRLLPVSLLPVYLNSPGPYHLPVDNNKKDQYRF